MSLTVSQRTIVSLVVLAFLLAGFFGEYRVVSGAPSLVVPRQYFGFDEPFASVADCTSSAWIVATAQHGKLCRDLQAAGILESDEAQKVRVQREVQRQTDSIMRSFR